MTPPIGGVVIYADDALKRNRLVVLSGAEEKSRAVQSLTTREIFEEFKLLIARTSYRSESAGWVESLFEQTTDPVCLNDSAGSVVV